MESTLLQKFRDKVNHKNVVYHMYVNQQGKNRWNIICSAMDWIEVVVASIDTQGLLGGHDNETSIKVMDFINHIDVLWEAIQQLHRVFIDDKSIPFKDAKNVFQHNQAGTTDNEYFKTIRACFSAHPINLNDVFLGNNGKERRYASWSTGMIGPGDISVILYSNETTKDNVFMGIYFDELIKFAQERYQYLETIGHEIDKKVACFYRMWQDRPIREADSPLEQIQVLIDESQKRLNNDYYNAELKKLQNIFATLITSHKNRCIVEEYKTALIAEINEIQSNLQAMRFEDLMSPDEIDDSCPDECQYIFAKMVEAVYGSSDSVIDFNLVFRKYLSKIIDFDNIHSLKELYVIVLAGFYKLNSKPG